MKTDDLKGDKGHFGDALSYKAAGTSGSIGGWACVNTFSNVFQEIPSSRHSARLLRPSCAIRTRTRVHHSMSRYTP